MAEKERGGGVFSHLSGVFIELQDSLMNGFTWKEKILIDGNTSLPKKKWSWISNIFFCIGFFFTCIFTMLAALLWNGELFTGVACLMLNFVYKFAIRVYKSEKHCILHSKHTELYYRTDVKSEF